VAGFFISGQAMNIPSIPVKLAKAHSIGGRRFDGRNSTRTG